MPSLTSTLNGIIGDYLDESGNELATPMGFYRNGEPLALSQLREEITPSCRLCILIHGLVNDESSWDFTHDRISNDADPNANAEDHHTKNYGKLLESDVEGLIPLFLRYNTGLHVSTNGRRLSTLLEALLDCVDDGSRRAVPIIILGHSMGGLVGRSAIHYATKHNVAWVKQVKQIIFLGTPHHGSYWEKAGNVVSCALNATPHPCARMVAKIANLRSSGIKDLRYGYIQDEDWQVNDQEQEEARSTNSWFLNTKKPTDIIDGISYHVVTGTVTTNPDHPMSLVFGDGLVSRASAQGRGDKLANGKQFIREFPGINHNTLQSNMEIYHHIKEWVLQSCSEEPLLPCSEQHELEESRKIHEKVRQNNLLIARTESSLRLCHEELFGSFFVHPNAKIAQDNPKKRQNSAPLFCSDQQDLKKKKEQNPKEEWENNSFTSGVAPTGDESNVEGGSSAKDLAKYRGAASLVHVAVGAGSRAVQDVHDEMVDGVYNIVGSFTPIAPAVQTVHVIHKGISGGVFGIIRGVNTVLEGVTTSVLLR